MKVLWKCLLPMLVFVIGYPKTARNVSLRTTENDRSEKSGDINVGANLQASDSIRIRVEDRGSITQSAGRISAPLVVLSSKQGNIGSAAAPMQTSSARLRATSDDSGSVYLAAAGGVELLPSEAGGNFSLT